MEKTQKRLMTFFVTSVVIALLMVILFETDLLPSGTMATNKNAEFLLATIMELLTLCAIPLALRLFKFKKVERQLTADGGSFDVLMKWGGLRMALLCIPLVVNTLLYYLFMNVAFGYMAIILLLSLFFIYPSLNRCIEETTE